MREPSPNYLIHSLFILVVTLETPYRRKFFVAFGATLISNQGFENVTDLIDDVIESAIKCPMEALSSNYSIHSCLIGTIGSSRYTLLVKDYSVDTRRIRMYRMEDLLILQGRRGNTSTSSARMRGTCLSKA